MKLSAFFNRRRLTWLVVGVILICVVSLRVRSARRQAWTTQQLTNRIHLAQEMLSDGKSDQAWQAVKAVDKGVLAAAEPEQLQQFHAAAVTVAAARHDYVNLREQFDRTPESFGDKEDAALLMARMLLEEENLQKLQDLVDHWRPRQIRPEPWFLLDVDVLLKTGHSEQALQLLNSRTLNGRFEGDRLGRLAILAAATNLNLSWTYLEQALQADPRNSDIRSFRAQILEASGKPAAARIEYVAALAADPDNPVKCLQLGDFYQRQFQYEMAIQTWSDGLQHPTLAVLWLRTLFWSRVTRSGIHGSFPESLPPGELRELIAFMQSLPDHVFWDDNAFDAVPQCDVYRNEREEVAWLRLLECLRQQNLNEAREILQTWSERLKLNAELAVCLHRLVDLKLGLPVSRPLSFAESIDNDLHPCIRLVNSVIRDQAHRMTDRKDLLADLQANSDQPAAILCRPDVFAAVCLAGGWPEAALTLADLQNNSQQELPDWWSFGIAQSLRLNRSGSRTIEYIDHLSSPPASLLLLKAECLLQLDHRETAISLLKTVASQQNSAGYRAAWIYATLLLETGQFADATAVVSTHKQLSVATEGQELLARIRLAGGETESAAKIYEALGTASVEGLAFRARSAFAKKDFEAARTYTNQLLLQMPDQLQLLANLKAIDEAEQEQELAL